MRYLFISDLHLDESRPKMTETFLRFLEVQAIQSDKVYILGDLFESWVGDDENSTLQKVVEKALNKLSNSGVHLYFMHGNRDFLIGRHFLKASGCQLLKDPSVIKAGKTPILLMHGDLLCTEDKKYLTFRKLAHNWFAQKLFLLLPLKKRLKMAEKIRAKSQAHQSTSPEHILDVTEPEVERVMQQHHCKLLIHGHTHRPAIHAGNQGTRIVLAAWHTAGNVLELDINENGQINYQLQDF